MRIGTKTFDATALAALAVLFIGIIMLSNVVLRGARLDLTENGLYTVSEGTRKILAGLQEPINLYYFFSESVAAQNTDDYTAVALRTYSRRIREMLEEFVLLADGRIRLTVIDPQPFSEEEDRATNFGLRSVPVGATSEPLYFGLAGTNPVDDTALVPFFQPSKEPFLEYDLAKLIHGLAHADRQVVGLMSWLPMQSGFDPATGQMRQPWIIANQIEERFELRRVDLETDRIADDIDVLMIVHPKEVSRQTQYAIDQFVLRGGRAVIFVDPHAEADTAGADPNNPYAAMATSKSSNLATLFQAWGIAYDPGSVVIDRQLALPVQTQPNQPPQRHLGYLQFGAARLDAEDVVTAGLEVVNAAMVGSVAAVEDGPTELMPLLLSSDDAMQVPAARFQFMPDPSSLRDGYAPAGQPQIVAARVRGEVASAFPDGPPAASTPDTGGDAEDEPDASAAPHLAKSQGPINLIVVADTDLLTDRFWVQQQNFFGQRLISAFADNGNFVANGIDNLTGSDELISIRAQATFSRPFDRVDALERSAEERFLATEQQLEQQLAETERKLTELQSRREDDNLAILTPEQRAEIERFQQEKLRIRRELRDVRRDLDRSIDQLGDVLKLLNIGLVPVLILLIGLLALAARTRRRDRAAGIGR